MNGVGVLNPTISLSLSLSRYHFDPPWVLSIKGLFFKNNSWAMEYGQQVTKIV